MTTQHPLHDEIVAAASTLRDTFDALADAGVSLLPKNRIALADENGIQRLTLWDVARICVERAADFERTTE